MPARPTVDRSRIRELASQGMTAKQIAERLGVSRTVVTRELARAKR